MSRRRQVRPVLQSMTIPAPTGGLNTVSAGKSMPPGDCPLLYNMLSGEHGLRVRLGTREWAGQTSSGAPGDGSLGLTIIGYHGSSETLDRLFIVTPTGIWDCTEGSGVASTQEVTFAITTGRAGRGSFHSFVTAGGHFLLYCDEENGYHVYTESTDTWAKIAQGGGASEVSGVNPANFCFVMSWKSRVWFVEKDTANAWYLDAGAIYGAATKLNLDRAAQLRNGGDLVGLWNWTLDGGSGIDDYLVAVTRGGDVAVYLGTDPDSADTFSLKGVWTVGSLVTGRRIVTPVGGDVLILTRSGPRAVSQLVSGGDGQGTYATAKVTNLFARLATDRGHLDGWEMWIHPDEHALIISIPNIGASDVDWLAMTLGNRSWSILREHRMGAVGQWRGKVYLVYSSSDNAAGLGTLWTSEGFVDLQQIDINEPALSIGFSLTTAFQSVGGLQVKVEIIRPTFLTQDGNLAWSANARYGYDLSELTSPSTSPGGSNAWDYGAWDSSTWQSDLGSADQRSKGATGVGSDFAVTLRGRSIGRTSLVSVDVLYQTGGPL